jgi:hypothetical protein
MVAPCYPRPPPPTRPPFPVTSPPRPSHAPRHALVTDLLLGPGQSAARAARLGELPLQPRHVRLKRLHLLPPMGVAMMDILITLIDSTHTPHVPYASRVTCASSASTSCPPHTHSSRPLRQPRLSLAASLPRSASLPPSLPPSPPHAPPLSLFRLRPPVPSPSPCSVLVPRSRLVPLSRLIPCPASSPVPPRSLVSSPCLAHASRSLSRRAHTYMNTRTHKTNTRTHVRFHLVREPELIQAAGMPGVAEVLQLLHLLPQLLQPKGDGCDLALPSSLVAASALQTNVQFAPVVRHTQTNQGRSLSRAESAKVGSLTSSAVEAVCDEASCRSASSAAMSRFCADSSCSLITLIRFSSCPTWERLGHISAAHVIQISLQRIYCYLLP